MTKPIALLIPVYNRQRLLGRALASIEPELHLLDIILVDDGSNPPIDTAAFPQYPIHLIRLPENRGIVGALNAGLEYIYTKDYEFIARLDSDDVVINQRFTKQVAFMRAHPDIGLVGSHFHLVRSNGEHFSDSIRPLTDRNIRKAMHIACMLGHTTLMMRADVARRNGFYDERYKASEDYEFYWRMLSLTRVENMKDFLMDYQVSADSISVKYRRAQAITGLKIKLRYFSFFNVYSYIGIVFSLLEITDTLKYTVRIRKMIFNRLF